MIPEAYLKEPNEISWRALAYFDLYRFLIALIFVSLFWVGQLPHTIGLYDEILFAASAHIYLFISLVFLFLIKIRKPPFVFQVAGQVFSDIVGVAVDGVDI